MSNYTLRKGISISSGPVRLFYRFNLLLYRPLLTPWSECGFQPYCNHRHNAGEAHFLGDTVLQRGSSDLEIMPRFQCFQDMGNIGVKKKTNDHSTIFALGTYRKYPHPQHYTDIFAGQNPQALTSKKIFLTKQGMSVMMNATSIMLALLRHRTPCVDTTKER